MLSKKAAVLGAFIALAIAGAGFFLLRPVNLLNQPDGYAIHRVTYHGEDITEQIDVPSLQQILSGCRAARLPHRFAPYQSSKVIIEINGHVDGNPLHILLGEINIAYSSSDEGGRRIENSEELLKEIASLLPQDAP